MEFTGTPRQGCITCSTSIFVKALCGDGVWSGCAFPTSQGTIILNTASRLRTTTPTSLLPPPDHDLGLQMIESQAYAVSVPDNAHHAPLYFMGNYNADKLKLDLATASGPFPLDLGGSTLYAPNLLTNDPLGRVVLWGWCQETGRPPFADLPTASTLASDDGSLGKEADAAPDHDRPRHGSDSSSSSWEVEAMDLTPSRPRDLPPHLSNQPHFEL
ncbi:hypothetical protein QJQ45_016630, partial [Haematococcus lacustris]